MSNGVSLSKYAMKDRKKIARNQLAERGEELEKQKGKRDLFDTFANTIVDIGTSALGVPEPLKLLLDPAIDKYAVDPLTDHIYGEVGEASADDWGFTTQEAKQINKAFEEDEMSYGELLASDLAEYVGEKGAGEIKEGFGEGSDFLKKLFPKKKKVGKLGGKIPKYENGGKLTAPSLEEFIKSYTKVHGDTDKESFKQMKSYYDPAYYDQLESDWKDDQNILSQIKQASIGTATDYMDELNYMAEERAERESPSIFSNAKEPKKSEGLIALLQRLIPGGESGYKEKYYGGGSVSGVPTISDYFSKQGKTLGGSNKQSLSQILGR